MLYDTLFFFILWNKFREIFMKVIKRNAEIHWLIIYLFLMHCFVSTVSVPNPQKNSLSRMFCNAFTFHWNIFLPLYPGMFLSFLSGLGSKAQVLQFPITFVRWIRKVCLITHFSPLCFREEVSKSLFKQ